MLEKKTILNSFEELKKVKLWKMKNGEFKPIHHMTQKEIEHAVNVCQRKQQENLYALKKAEYDMKLFSDKKEELLNEITSRIDKK